MGTPLAGRNILLAGSWPGFGVMGRVQPRTLYYVYGIFWIICLCVSAHYKQLTFKDVKIHTKVGLGSVEGPNTLHRHMSAKNGLCLAYSPKPGEYSPVGCPLQPRIIPCPSQPHWGLGVPSGGVGRRLGRSGSKQRPRRPRWGHRSFRRGGGSLALMLGPPSSEHRSPNAGGGQ